MRHPAILAAGVLAATTGSAHALTITTNELPSTLGCEANSYSCTVALTSSVDTEYLSAFFIARMRPDNSGYDLNWLVRYELTAPSAVLTDIHPDYSGTGARYTTPYTGHIWLEAPQTLNLSGQNIFRIYTDHITPDPDANNYQDNLSTWIFGMDTQAAINGGATYYYSGGDGYEDPVSSGNLAVIDGLFICVECGIDVRLNLIGLQYAANGTSSFNPADTRGLLLQYEDFYSYYFTSTRNFYVQAVPLPAAAWLFGWGLAAIGLVARKR